jgi:hypothetical protein
VQVRCTRRWKRLKSSKRKLFFRMVIGRQLEPFQTSYQPKKQFFVTGNIMTTQLWMTIYQNYMNSQEWRAKREKVLIFWGNRCALCNSQDRIQVHHRTYERLGQELLTDLIPLCYKCHDRHTEFMRHGMEHISSPLQRIAERMK